MEKIKSPFGDKPEDITSQINPDNPDKYEIMTGEMEKEFEEECGDLKEKMNPDVYDELKRRVLQEKIKSCEQLEESNEITEDKAEELFKSLIDSTTGLKRREELFKDMDKKFEKLFGIESIKNLDNGKLLEVFDKHKADDFKSKHLNVMMGDMSYLSLANKEGHRTGDELLGRTGKVILEELHKASRHGGDEFTALIELGEQEAKDKVKKLELKIKKIKSIPILEKHKLEPNLDIGMAHFSEGYEAFKAVTEKIESKEGREKLLKLNFLKELQNIWLEIADKRSFIKKGIRRIVLLIDFKKDKLKHNYSDIIDFLRKGGYNIKDGELEKLTEEIQAVANKDERIFAFIKKNEEAAIKEKNGIDRDKAEVVFKIAKREFSFA
ncbi:diguanylate cyclase [Candidatus Parcubacteria bacterium]|nr:diguanylate cyclase [Candidatus Parcubacteria bacterium]